MRSSMGSAASMVTSAVISLVMDAMGDTWPPFLLSSTSPVFWSMTRATAELRASGEPAVLMPRIWPSVLLAGTDTRTKLERSGTAATRVTAVGAAVAISEAATGELLSAT